jgi:signal transduction histidine kinase
MNSQPQQATANTDQQTWLLSDVLEHTQANLTLLRPIRNEAGQIIDFEYLFTNSANARMTGRTVAEMTGGQMLTMFPGIRTTVFYTHLLHTTETGETTQFLFEFEADGVAGWFDTSLVRQGDNVLFTCLDVTPLKQAELAQKRQNEWLNTLIDHSPMAICYFSPVQDTGGKLVDFQLTKLNAVHAQTLGGSVAEITGRRVLEHYPGSVGNGFYERMVTTTETGEAQRFVIHYNVDGLDVWGDVQMSHLDGGVLMSYLNISDIKNAELQQQRQAELLAVANAELRRSNEHLQEFAYIASHDLQEPLRKIQSFSDMLRTQQAGELSPQSVDMLTRMRNAAERMSGLVSDLLTYSRLHTQHETFVPVNLASVVKTVLNDLDLLIRESQAELTVGTLPTVQGHTGQLQQLILNLLTNALKYVLPGQKPVIQISSRLLEATALPATVRAGLVEKGGLLKQAYWEISVQDNGIGFNEKYVGRLFKMFQRLHSRSQYTGSGIGLAICKRVVDGHGGGITARSTPEVGSTFLVYLPSK